MTLTTYQTKARAELSNLIFEDHEGDIEHVDASKEELLKIVDTLLSDFLDEVVEVLEKTYSEHEEYTDETLRYHKKQLQAFKTFREGDGEV